MRLICCAVSTVGFLAVFTAASRMTIGSEGEDAQNVAAPVVATELPGSRSADLFTTRILPLANSPEGSSCTDCHFSGVELKNYIAGDEATTFAALRAAGLIDVDQPSNSKLLQFISRKPETPNELTERVRVQEMDAFSAWISEAVENPSMLKAVAPEQLNQAASAEIIRHARKDRVVNAFIDAVWTERQRCQSCHSPEFNRNRIGRHTRDANIDQLRKESVLPPGRYRGVIRLDKDDRLQDDPSSRLTDADLVGQFEVHGDWPPGYQPPRIVKFPRSAVRD